MYMCTGTCSCLCAHSGAREGCRLLCSITSSYSLETGSFPEPEAPRSGEAGWPAGSRELPVSCSWMAIAWLWSGDWRFKLGSLTCTVSAVMHRASSQPSVPLNHPVWSLLLQQPQEMNFSMWPLKSTHARSPLMVLREPASYTSALPLCLFPSLCLTPPSNKDPVMSSPVPAMSGDVCASVFSWNQYIWVFFFSVAPIL